jgi:hypothetical protein
MSTTESAFISACEATKEGIIFELLAIIPPILSVKTKNDNLSFFWEHKPVILILDTWTLILGYS